MTFFYGKVVKWCKVKIYVIIEKARQQYRYGCYMKSDDEAIEEYQKYIQQIPKIDDLQSYRISSPISYNTALEQLILDYKLLEELADKLESSVCLRERKSILLKAVELYKQGELDIMPKELYCIFLIIEVPPNA
ncbi:MAG: hypothetical protein HFI77_15340 [Lachnospiraceae bacterium]|nr:hypothetical protein [Lachnospiraceae bacterium]